jgi:hypothetical protein
MAQVVSRRALTAEACVHSRVSPCGICGRQSSTRTGFYRVLRFCPVSIIPLWLSVLIFPLGDEQLGRWRPQFRDIVLPNGREQLEGKSKCSSVCMVCKNDLASQWIVVYERVWCASLFHAVKTIHFQYF